MIKTSLIAMFLTSLLLATPQQQAVLAYNHSATGITFPDFLGDMRRGEVTDYEKKERGLGLGLAYHMPNIGVADVFVYNLGLKSIPNDLQSKEIVSHFSQVKGDIFRTYQWVQELSAGMDPIDDTAPVSAFRALSAHFSYTHPIDGLERRSYVYLAVHRNNFVKVRFSYRKEQETEARRVLLRFLDDLGKLLAKKNSF